jgi:hypothetical protein
LCTAEYLELNSILIKMVRENKITAQEREELLQKSGLLKLEDGKWAQDANSTLTLINS